MKKRPLTTFLKCLLAGLLATAEMTVWDLPQAIAAGVFVSGQVRNDANSNGNISDSDPGISGVTVKLYQDDGTGNPTGVEIATTTTDSSGNYSFADIAVGNYVIVETNPTNYVSSGDSQGANDDKIAVSVGSFDKTNNIFLDVDTTLLDYGDAPNTYSTLSASSGARHSRNGTLYLGSGVTGENDGQPNATATGDTYDDGITLSPSLGANYSTLIQAGISNAIVVVSSGAGFLNAWVDYNQNGVFDSGEQIFTNQAVSTSTNTLTFPTPPPNTILHGPTMARFRLSPTSIVSPTATGLVSGGEVEDYQVNVAAPVPNSASCVNTGLLNGEFDSPDTSSSTPFLNDFGNNIRTYDEKLVPGWNTTATDNGIELWKNGSLSVPTYNGSGQFAEINANQAAALFQDIATVPGATLTWQLAHRARQGIDTMDIKAGAPGAVVLQRRVSTDTNGWVFYRGTYVVPAGQYITRFQFEAVSTGSGSATVGNFIDAVQFSTSDCVTLVYSPTIDLDANNSSGAIGNNFRGVFVGGGTQRPAADTDVSITDDKTNIASATITLTNRPDGGSESLSIDATAGGTVSGVTASSYNSSTGVITLSGSNTLANYAAIIATLKYRNTTSSPNSSDRIISVQVIDSNSLRSNVALSTLSLNLPPTVDLDRNDSSGASGSDYTNKFVAGAGVVSAADTDVVTTDDGANLASATITLTNRPDGTAESLSIDTTAGGTITSGLITAGTYNSSTGRLTLTGTTTLTNYQRVLATLKYNNTNANPDLTSRTITVQVTDSNNSLLSNTAVSTITMLKPPTIDLDSNNSSGATGNAYKNTFIAGSGAVSAADSDVAITDDKTNIASTTITLTNQPNGTAESLSIDATAGGTVSGVTATAYNSSTGQLTLSGSQTLANYQAIIATLKYNNTAASPNTTNRVINVQVIDSDSLTSNTAVSTLSITIPPDLTLTKAHTGHFTVGSTGTYTMTVGNSGGSSTSGTITFTDTLPTGLTVNNGAAGAVTLGGTNAANWTCTSNAATPQVITCTSTTAIAASGSSVFTFSVSVGLGTAVGTNSITNTASVSGGGQSNTANDSSNDPTTILSPDLTITKSHTGNFTQGGTGSYNLTVSNGGTAATSGTVTVVDTLPTGLSVASGTVTLTGTNAANWSCTASGQTITCTSSTAIATSGSSTFGFNVNVASNAPSSVTNSVAVSGGNEATSQNGNNSATDPTTVVAALVTISGTVFDDADGSKIQEGSEGFFTATGLNAVLVNSSTGNVVATTPVSSGAFSFSNVQGSANYTVLITTNTATVGSAPPAVALPSNWVSTGENLSGVADGTIDSQISVSVTTRNIANANFGIEQLPDTNPISATAQNNPGGTTPVQVPTLSGADPEDGALGTGKTFQVVTLPSNGTLYYNGSAVTAGQMLTNYTPSLLTIDPNDGSITVTFTYAAVDAASQVDATPATVTIPFLTPAHVLLVKRITAVNGDRTQNPNDATPLNQFVDDTTSARQADDNSTNWPTNYLMGAINAGNVKPGDTLEYTIYFLNAGSSSANNVRVCDRMTGVQTFLADAYGTGQDLQLKIGTGSIINLTQISDRGDRAQFFTDSSNAPATCNLKPLPPGKADNGTLMIDLTGSGNGTQPDLSPLPGSTGVGMPDNAYGWFRFRTKVQE